MGGLFKPKKQNTTSTSNPYGALPGWAQKYYRDDVRAGEQLIDNAGDIANFRGNNPDSIVGMHPDEIFAIENMQAENAQAQGLLDNSVDAIGGDRFMSQYTDDVVDSSLANLDREDMRRRAERGASTESIGGMANTRAGVADALGQQLHGLNRAELESSLRDRAFQFGTNAGFQESDTLQNIAGTGMTLQNSASQWQGTGGEVQRGIDQQRSNLPTDTLSWYANVFNSSRGLPPTGGGSKTGQQLTPSPASSILGAASTAAGIFTALSDERAKEDIEAEGGALDKLRDVGAFSYRYKDGLGHTDQRTTGLMAQDLERAGIEGAVMEGEDGLKRVDPYPVLATIAQAVRELDDRTRSAGI